MRPRSTGYPEPLSSSAWGNWGAQELNYSSDIDLIYVYDPDELGDSDSHTFFQKLARSSPAP